MMDKNFMIIQFLDTRRAHLLCYPITIKIQKEKGNNFKTTRTRMHIIKMLKMHQIISLNINLTTVGMPKINQANDITILILVTYIIRDQMVDAIKLKIKIL
jgi:hypothetical protein